MREFSWITVVTAWAAACPETFRGERSRHVAMRIQECLPRVRDHRRCCPRGNVDRVARIWRKRKRHPPAYPSPMSVPATRGRTGGVRGRARRLGGRWPQAISPRRGPFDGTRTLATVLARDTLASGSIPRGFLSTWRSTCPTKLKPKDSSRKGPQVGEDAAVLQGHGEG
jgi:hypothetical protein